TSPLLVEKSFFDEASVVYVEQALRKMNGTISRLLDCLPQLSDEENSLSQRYKALLNSPQLMKLDLDTFIHDLIEFSREAALNDGDAHNKETLTKSASLLQRQKDAFAILLQSQQQHCHSFIKKAKEMHPTAFSASTHPAIHQAAKKVTDRFLSGDMTDMNIRTLSTDLQNLRLTAAEPLKMLKILEAFGRIQQEYLVISKKRKAEIEQLTGEEKAKALDLLESLNQDINSLDSIPEDGSVEAYMLAAYHEKLVQADQLFNPIFATETLKNELKAALNKEIDGFIEELDVHVASIAELEKYFSIQFKEVNELLKKKRHDILGLKKEGLIPSSYMNYAPKSVLATIYYYARSALSFDGINVDDLNPADLALYIENTKAEISIQKGEIARSSLSEAQKALKAFQEQSKELDAHIKKLTIGVPKRSNFGMGELSQIPTGITPADEPKLQFHNAMDTELKQKNIYAQLKQSISAQPNLKTVLKQLSANTQALKKLLDQSQKTENLSLLLQIEKMDAYPAQQKLAKLAFIETLTTKMVAHTKLMTQSISALASLPKIHEEAERLIDRTKQDLTAKLKSAHATVQSHVELWEPIRKAGSDSFSTKKDLAVESLSAYDLHSYSEMIDHAIKTGSAHMDLISTTYKKADSASHVYKLKVKEARNYVSKLDSKNQVIYMKKLEYVLDDVEKSKENYSGLASSTKPEGWFSTLVSFMTSAPNLTGYSQPNLAVLRLMEDYKKNIGESIARIDAAMKQFNNIMELTIPQQLKISPNDEISEELRERYSKQILPSIKTARDSLEKYKQNGNTHKIFSRYVSPELLDKIDNTIDVKLAELDKFEKGHQTDGIFSNLFSDSNTPFSELDADQMESFERKFDRFISNFEQDLDDRFLIKTLLNSQALYESAKNGMAKTHAIDLRANGHFKEAHLFEEAIGKIEREEAEWQKKVTCESQISDLNKALNILTRQIIEAINVHNPDVRTSLDEQIRKLLDDKNSLSSPFSIFGYSENDSQRLQKIDLDFLSLKTMIIEKVETGYEAHQKYLRSLTVKLDDWYSKYDIMTICPKPTLQNSIDRELNKFLNSHTIGNTLSSYFYTPKRIDDMSPQEIAEARPEERHEEQIKASKKAILEYFNYEIFSSNHDDLMNTLESTEKLVLKLKTAGQIMQADKLDTDLKAVKKEYDAFRKVKITNEDGLRQLDSNLAILKDTLQLAQTAANNKVDYSILEQLKFLPKDSPFRNELKKILVKDIQNKITEKKTEITKSIESLDKLVQRVGFPISWRDSIVEKLEESRTEMEKAGKGMSVKTTGWLNNTTSNYSLGELSVDQLKIVLKDIIKKVDTLDTFFENYYLKATNEAFEDYENQLTNIQKLKIKWKAELHDESAKKLDAKVNDKKVRLTAHFAPSEKNNKTLQENMWSLQDLLTTLKSELSSETEAIKKAKPELISTLMESNHVTPEELKKLRIALKKDIKKKLLEQTTLLNDYKTKINVINERIKLISSDSQSIPHAWRMLVENRIKQSQQQLNDCIKGLPELNSDNDVSWKPFESLSGQEYSQYEKLINKLTGAKTKKASILGELENTIDLEELVKHLT
ncbi:MAG TPA: hypothetical protein VGP47_05865, partial [Parachlamydiaceae bacterium]|nr:hypothetical protein [Parachlamydiaceae bacterium]